MKKCDIHVLDERTKLSKDTKEIIEAVTVEMDKMPVGTFKYKLFKYPGDIDLFENLETCCTFGKAKFTAAHNIQKIIPNIENNNKVMFSDFKAGYDLRFKIYTGNINGEIEDYNYQVISRDIKNLYDANLLDDCEYEELINLVKVNPEMNDIITLNEKLRDYWVLRWSLVEIKQGYKLLRGNYKLYLDVAISQGSIVKLDTIAYVDKRFVEVTNFFLITSLDKYGNKYYLSEELADYGESLLSDVYKYYDINPLKSVKRLWMWFAFKQRICELGMFKELFSSDIALYSQILSDIDVAITLLNTDNNMFGNVNVLLSLIPRLKLLDGLCNVNTIFNIFITNEHNYKLISSELEKLRNCLQEYINNNTYKWLQDHDLDIFEFVN